MRMGNESGQCVTEVRKRENLYSKDFHFRTAGRSEYTTVQRKVDDGPFPAFPAIKYYLISHCKGYRWKYVPKPKTSSALYIEYPELRDYDVKDGKFYGVFSSALANEQSHTAKSRPSDSFNTLQGSAVCTFSMEDIVDAFNGPFKKKDKLTGSYRPFGDESIKSISPSPYSSDNDVKAQLSAQAMKDMTIDFLDPTLPFSEELRNIDLRKHSSRLNFFEEDVYGTRTMWNDVKTQPIHSESGVVFEQVVTQQIGDTTLLYIATSEGHIYKISSVENPSYSCRMTNPADYIKWLNTTKSMSSIWDNEFYAYYNRTIDSVSFAASFESDLTREKGVKFPDDTLITSDWDCEPPVKTRVLAIFKPFDAPTKIWDMKITTSNGKSMLVLATDNVVKQIPTLQCSIYTHCKACSADPQCLWEKTQGSQNETVSNCVNLGQRSKPSNPCSCNATVITKNPNENLVLPGLDRTTDLDSYQWYHNYSVIKYKPHQMMYAHDTSLIIFNLLANDSGLYQLRNKRTDECMLAYRVALTTCIEVECRYESEYRKWCKEYADFQSEYEAWHQDYGNADYCRNLL